MSRNIAKTYVINSAAAGGTVIQVSAKFLFIASATENLTIKVEDSDGTIIGDIENFPAGLGQPFSEGFVKLTVTTVSGNAGSASLIMGSDMPTFTMLTGTVNIVDQKAPRARALSGISMRSWWSVAQNGVSTAYMMLRNPIGSGKNLIVYSILCASVGGSDTMNWGMFLGGAVNANFANVSGTENVYGGQPAGVGIVSCQNTGGGAFVQTQFGIGNPIDEDFDSCPQIISPGNALYIGTANANFGLQGETQWDEEAIL